MPYFKKVTKAGPYLKVETYYAMRDGRRLTRGKNRGVTPEDQQKRNDMRSAEYLRQILYGSFTPRVDYLATYTHGAAITEEQAKKEGSELTKRLAKEFKRKGLPAPRWVRVTEKQGQWHHHLIISAGLTLEEMQAVWGERGRFQLSTLDDGEQYYNLVTYLLAEEKEGADGRNIKPERVKNGRRWNGSRNLVRPEVTKKPVKRPPRKGEPKPPKGYRLLNTWYEGCDGFGNSYQRYECLKGAFSPFTKTKGAKEMEGAKPPDVWIPKGGIGGLDWGRRR